VQLPPIRRSTGYAVASANALNKFIENISLVSLAACYMNEIMSYPQLVRNDHHSIKGIQYPGKNDVLFGRGGKRVCYNLPGLGTILLNLSRMIFVTPILIKGAINSHVGNIMFRKIVDEQRPFYFAASKADKPLVALRVVQIVRKLDPPGRFLAPMRDSERNLVKGDGVIWYDVGNKKARAKASQCLRERKMCDASIDHENDNDRDTEERQCLPSHIPSFQGCESPNKICYYTASLVPESPLSTGIGIDLFHGILRNHRHEDPIMFEYSPISTAYAKQTSLQLNATSTPALMPYQENILPTVSRGDETGLIGHDGTTIDPLHFFELGCRAHNFTGSKQVLHQEEKWPPTIPMQDFSHVDPLLMLPSEVGVTRENSLWTPSFHSDNSYDLDVSDNTFTVTVLPRSNERNTISIAGPSAVRSFSIKQERTESMSDLTDSSVTDEFLN
jgi:hypothetical protein